MISRIAGKAPMTWSETPYLSEVVLVVTYHSLENRRTVEMRIVAGLLEESPAVQFSASRATAAVELWQEMWAACLEQVVVVAMLAAVGWKWENSLP